MRVTKRRPGIASKLRHSNPERVAPISVEALAARAWRLAAAPHSLTRATALWLLEQLAHLSQQLPSSAESRAPHCTPDESNLAPAASGNCVP